MIDLTLFMQFMKSARRICDRWSLHDVVHQQYEFLFHGFSQVVAITFLSI